MDLEARPFVLREAVEASLDILAPAAAKKGLELVYAVDEDLPVALVGDAGPPAADRPQPALERREVHRVGRGGRDRRRHAGRGEASAAGRLAGRSGSTCATPASASPTDAMEQAVPVVQPGGRLDRAPLRRHRPRPGDLATPGGADGWLADRREHAASPARAAPSTSSSACRSPPPDAVTPARAPAGRGGPAGRSGADRGRQRHQSPDPGRADGQVGHGAARDGLAGRGAASG